jgi:hypothetical protein
MGGKGGRGVGLTTLPPSFADYLEIWKPQAPVTIRVCTGIALIFIKRTVLINSFLVCICCIWPCMWQTFQSLCKSANQASTYRLVVKHTDLAVQTYSGPHSCCHILRLCALFKIRSPTRPLVMMMHWWHPVYKMVSNWSCRDFWCNWVR